MDITKAKRLYELSKDNRKILLTVWEGDNISSCVEEAEKKYCETCQGDDTLCRDYVEHLKSQGYSATEVELGAPESAESLPRFVLERGVAAKVETVLETEVAGHADVETAETSPGDSGEE